MTPRVLRSHNIDEDPPARIILVIVVRATC
jgi:hypothetical protein